MKRELPWIDPAMPASLQASVNLFPYCSDVPASYYVHPREVWSADKCQKLAKHWGKDAWGSRGPIGLICSDSSAYGGM